MKTERLIKLESDHDQAKMDLDQAASNYQSLFSEYNELQKQLESVKLRLLSADNALNKQIEKEARIANEIISLRHGNV